jgi:hypothetical protein
MSAAIDHALLITLAPSIERYPISLVAMKGSDTSESICRRLVEKRSRRNVSVVKLESEMPPEWGTRKISSPSRKNC